MSDRIVAVIPERYSANLKPQNRIVSVLMPTRVYHVIAPVGFYPVRGQQSFTECAQSAERWLRKGSPCDG